MNIKIAICDDEHQQIKYITTLVSKWADENNITITIQAFDSAESFSGESSGGEAFDILLLDIQMSGQNGIELAREIRQSNTELAIIFITGFADYMSEGYDVSALHYLMKPVMEDKLFETLDKAYKNLIQSKQFLIVNSKGKDCRILFSDIVCIEAFKHYVTITTANGAEYEVRRNISDIESELDNSFFRCQRSYIIMIGHIQHISKTDVLMDNGKLISLSRNVYKDLYNAFIRYFKGKEEFLDGR